MKKSGKKKRKLFWGYKIILGLLFLMSILFVVGLMIINILTLKLFMLVLGVLLTFDFVFWLFIARSRKKKTFSVLALLFTIILSILIFYLFKTNGFFSSMSSNYKTFNYSVLVLKDSDYKKIGDLEGEKLGYFDNDSEEEEKSLEYLIKKVDVVYSEYDDTNLLVEGLFDSSVEAILIEDSYLNMLKEENSLISTDTLVIYTFKVKIKIEDFSRDIDVTKNTFSVFISGIDTYGTVDSVSRSDVNMVVTVNPKTKQILMTSIPRDYYVSLHDINGYKDKITHAGLYGIDTSVKTVEDLLGIDINYYVKVNFTSVTTIVDVLGGVDVYSEYSFTSIDGYNYSKGYNYVNGEEALSFARERQAFASGDNQRIKNQQALIQAIFSKCISKDIIYKYTKLLDGLSGSFVTNMSSSRITSLIKMQISDMASWTITSNSLKGSDSSNYTYSYPSQKLYVMEPIIDSVNEASELISVVYDGDILESSYDPKTGVSSIVTKSSVSSNNTIKKEETKKEENKQEDGITSVSSSVVDDKIEEKKDKNEEEDISSGMVDDDNSSLDIPSDNLVEGKDDNSSLEDGGNDDNTSVSELEEDKDIVKKED